MTAKRLEIFVIVTIIGIIGIIYAFTQKPVQAPVQVSSQNQEINAEVPQTFEYQGEDGKNALDLLKAKHQVETQHYEFGDFVTSINGVKADSSHFWAMYVNGEMSQVGASAYLTKSTDTIKWQLEKIQ